MVVNYVVKPEEAEKVAEEFRRGGRRAMIAQADVADEAQVQAMFAAAVREFGSSTSSSAMRAWNAMLPFTIDLRAMGCGDERQPARRIPVLHARRCANSCAAASSRISVAAAKYLHQLGARDHSVGRTCELRGVERRPDAADESLAQEVAEKRIRVNSIRRCHSHADQRSRLGHARGLCRADEALPYKRIGEVEEIGRAAVWLASDFTDYVVGTTLFIDGGMTLYPGFETGG